VRLFVFIGVAASVGFGQSNSDTLITDINGQTVVASASVSTSSTTPIGTDKTQTKMTKSLNGSAVPLEQVEERVLRQDSTGKVSERIVRRYDPNGRLTSTERVVSEEQHQSDGGATVNSTTYRTDLDGREQQTEKSVAQKRVEGGTTTTDTSISQPTINGTFDVTEKRTAVTTGDKDKQTTTESVYRSSISGGLQEAVRRVTVATQTADQAVAQTAQYEPGLNGGMQLKSQKVTTTTKQADGAETTQVNVYGADAPGEVRQESSPQKLQEQQIVTREKAPDGSVVEKLSVRRPTLSDPGRLGSAEQISQTVCTGKCDSSKP
jgi:hypothetical protein